MDGLCPGENPQHPFIPGSVAHCGPIAPLSLFHTSKVPRDFASSFPNQFFQLSLFDLPAPLLRGDLCLLPCSSRRLLPPLLGTECCPALSPLQTRAALQSWECSACSGRERTTVIRKLHIFPPYVAEISLPACAMLCCFCLSSSLDFSFADGFPLVPFGGDTGAFGWHFHALLAFSSGGFCSPAAASCCCGSGQSESVTPRPQFIAKDLL